ncbi:MAG: restriction endonuclease [archaeon]
MSKSIRELCERREVRSLLAWVLEDNSEVKPTWIGKSFGFPELSRRLDVPDVTPVLEELTSVGIFEKVPCDMELTCPTCSSSQELRTKYVCPFCGELNLKKGPLVEHYSCGYVGFRHEFTSGEKLVCPKCRKELRLVGTDYRIVENMFNCKSCRANFSVPGFVVRCYHCSKNYSLEEPNLGIVWAYRFREELRGEVMTSCVMDSALVSLYLEAGYEVERSKQLKGESGLVHTFDIVSTKEEKKTAILISSSSDGVGSDAVISFFAKKVDVNPEYAVLVAMPRLTDDAKKLAEVYGIETVEGKDLQEIVMQLRNRLGSVRDSPTEKEENDLILSEIRERRKRISEFLEKS